MHLPSNVLFSVHCWVRSIARIIVYLMSLSLVNLQQGLT